MAAGTNGPLAVDGGARPRPRGSCARRADAGSSGRCASRKPRFEGTDFVVGVGPMSTTFKVSRPPYDGGGTWKMVVDGVDNAVASAYGGWPDRLYLVGRDGRIAFQGDEGPFGFKPDELERAIEQELPQS